MAKKMHAIGLLQQLLLIAVDYFILFAFFWVLRSFSYIVGFANNPAVENTCQSVECVTTHNMFFIGQQSVLSSWTALVGDLKYFVSIMYNNPAVFLLRFHVAMLVSFSGTLSCQSVVIKTTDVFFIRPTTTESVVTAL